MSKHRGNGNLKISKGILIFLLTVALIFISIFSIIFLQNRSNNQKNQLSNSCVSGTEQISVNSELSQTQILQKLATRYNNQKTIIRDKCIEISIRSDTNKNIYNQKNKNDINVFTNDFWISNNSVYDDFLLKDSIGIVIHKKFQKKIKLANFSLENILQQFSKNKKIFSNNSKNKFSLNLSILNNVNLQNEINYSILTNKIKLNKRFLIQTKQLSKNTNLETIIDVMEKISKNKESNSVLSYKSNYKELIKNKPKSFYEFIPVGIDFNSKIIFNKNLDSDNVAKTSAIESFLMFLAKNYEKVNNNFEILNNFKPQKILTKNIEIKLK